MGRCQIISLLFFVTLTLSACISELPKPGYARTMLKVSRSLPGETEELKVRTSEGNLATLIVKRRDKSSFTFNNSNSVPKLPQEESNVIAANGSDSYASVQSKSKFNDDEDEAKKKKEEARRLEKAQVEQIKVTFSKFSEPKNEKPDDVNQTNETTVSKQSQITNDSVIDYGKWTPLETNGRALQQEPNEVEEYRNWKPLLSEDPKIIVTERTNYSWFNKAEIGSDILFAKNFQDRTQRNLEFENGSGNKNEQAVYYTYIPHQSPPSTRTNIGANLSKNRNGKHVPPEVTVRSEISVKSVPKRSSMSLDSDGTPVIHGTRTSDNPIDKIQTWRNARVINNKLVTAEGKSSVVSIEPSVRPYFTDGAETKQKFEKFIKDVNQRYSRNYDGNGHVYFEWNPKDYKSKALKAEIYEPRNDHYRANVHKRMLRPDDIASYPISQRYTPDSQSIAPVALKPGARAPVLQYAHPELGVQPAKIVKNEKRRPDNFPESQHSFTEQRYKKKYMLNNKNIVDSYTVKNYYPNQHFYGLKRPNEPPFWVKISENLKNQFSTGVERVSQFTRPVIDPLVEATHKISQNLGLSKGKEAQDKIGTVMSGTSILIPALGLVASGAALGIGAVAVGRYLDVGVLKRVNADSVNLEHKRALEAGSYLKTIEDKNPGSSRTILQTLYVLQNVPQEAEAANESAGSIGSDGVFLVLEEDKQNDEKTENRESKQVVDEGEYVETGVRRRKRSIDYLDIFKTETEMRNLVRNKRFQRKGADSISEIIEIDLPSSRIGITEFLIPKSKRKHSNKDTVLIIEDSSKTPSGRFEADMSGQNAKNNAQVVDDIDNSQIISLMREKNNRRSDSKKKTVKYENNNVDFQEENNGRQKRSIESDQELLDALQNLENAEVAEVAHVEGDWTNTPCAKKIFCDAIIQREPDVAMLMEKKMAVLLRLDERPTSLAHV